MFNPANNDWARTMLTALGVPERIFCDIVQPGTFVGRMTDENINDFGDIKVISVAQHDTGSAVAAVPSNEKDFLYISSGTWSLVGTEVEKPVINEKTFKHNFTNEGGVFSTYRLLKNVMGLWIVQECKRYWDGVGEEYSYAQLENMAWNASPLKSFIDPDYSAFGEPGDMPSKIVQFCKNTGQKPPGDKGELIRCIIESLALKYRYVIESLEDITGKTYNSIHIVGGGVKDKILCSFTAQACKKDVVAGPVEATAIGNIAIQVAALENITTATQVREIIKNSFNTQVYQSSSNAEWEEAYSRFCRIIK
jgi:sugar (pentulose or hexulose) kinase